MGAEKLSIHKLLVGGNMAHATTSRVGFECPAVAKSIEPQLKLNDTITKYLTENTESEDFANHTKDELIEMILKLKDVLSKSHELFVSYFVDC